MVHVLVLEQLYPEMEEATVGRWLVSPDDAVSAEQPLAELITDKVAYEYRSPAAGTMLMILTPVKSVVPVGTALAVLGAAGETVEHIEELLETNRRLSAEREAKLLMVQQATAGDESAPAASRPGGTVRATPAARRLARERGIDLATVKGSGPGGMITVEDIG